jgi:hypothetical protein
LTRKSRGGGLGSCQLEAASFNIPDVEIASTKLKVLDRRLAMLNTQG